MGRARPFVYAQTERALRSRGGLLDMVDHAASRVFMGLTRLDLDSIGVNEFERRYLRLKVEGAYGTIQQHVNVVLLALASTSTDLPLERTTLVDYGGGSGLTGLIAKEAGVGAVIYVDQSADACQTARALSKALALPLDAFIHGEVSELRNHVTERGLLVDAVCSSDVIEHLYDTRRFYDNLAMVHTENL